MSFLRMGSFFFIRVNIGPFIQGTGFFPLSFFFRIQSATPSKKVSFQLCQSLSISRFPLDIALDKFAA